MPSADVVVVGAGLAGLTAALGLAERGARVEVVAAGHAGTHWVGGPIDVAAPPGASSARQGLATLAAHAGHPYTFLGPDVDSAIDWFLRATRAAALPHEGTIDAPLAALPTGLGATRPVSIVPAGQSGALPPWGADECLVIVGPAGFKDLWPHAVAASLAREHVWAGQSRPASVTGLSVEVPGLRGRHNLTALVLAHQFDDPGWRSGALDAIARAIARVRGPMRIGLPAALGLREHATALEHAQRRLGWPVFEIPLVPPSIPGLRQYEALRSAIRARGGRVQIGEPVARVETEGRRVLAVATPAAVREHVVRTEALVLATGGIAGGGLSGQVDGRLRELVLDLPVEGPRIEDWLSGEALDPSSHPIASAGVRTDDQLRPVDPARPGAGPVLENVRVVGGLLAGQNYLRERCGDGVAIASAHVASASLAGGAATERALAHGGVR
jgi:glycerol-3-phosphate dehydrogenase subunit B